MFDKAAAAEALVEHESRLKRVQSQSRSGSLPLPASHQAQGARSSTQAARNAARALQSLDSEVRGTLDLAGGGMRIAVQGKHRIQGHSLSSNLGGVCMWVQRCCRFH